MTYPKSLELVTREIDTDEYEYFDMSYENYDRILQDLGRLVVKGGKILDVGSHLLHMPMVASAMGFSAHGIDIDYFVNDEKIRQRAAKYGIELRACTFPADKIPYPDAFFDAVTFTEVLEHLNFSPLPILMELNRVLKPGGKLFLTTPNSFRLGKRVHAILGRGSTYLDLDEFLTRPSFAIHWREYTHAELIHLLQKSGFAKQKVEYVMMNYRIGAANNGRVIRFLYSKAMILTPSLRNQLYAIASVAED